MISVQTLFTFGFILAMGVSRSAADEPAAINDRALHQNLLTSLEAAMKEGQLIPAETLREQLNRKSCELDLPTADENQPEKSPPQLYREASESVLMLGNLYKCDRCEKWHTAAVGAVVLTEGGVAATNHHVFKEEKAAFWGAMTRSGKFHPVLEVLAASEANDVVLFQLGGDDFNPTPLLPAQVGEPVGVISHPGGYCYSFTTGIVSRYAMDRSAPFQKTIEITAPYAKGSSGSPVFGPRGYVTGLVCKTRTFFFEDKDGDSRTPQMVKMVCVPVSAIRKLTKAP